MAERILLIVASVTQTGDIPHIAGALALRANTNALILHDAGVDIAQLNELYQHAAAAAQGGRADRVQFLSISPSQVVADPHRKLYNALKYCKDLRRPTNSQTKMIKDVLNDIAYTAFTRKYCVPVSNTNQEAKFAVLRLTEATEQIAQAFQGNMINSYELIARSFLFKLPIDNIISPEGKFAGIALPPTNKPVLLVWARYTGTKTDDGFNAEGDSDPTGQNQLVASGTKLGFSVITIGDKPTASMRSVVNTAQWQLDEFWTQVPLLGQGRAAQCSFFAALMQRYSGRMYQIGQKTGAMDFPALLGVPTIYIEDSQISTAATSRMRKWTKHDSMQLYRRVEVVNPPSLPGKGARTAVSFFYGDEDAREEREKMGEAKWRMLGLMFPLRKKWTAITGRDIQPLGFADVADAVDAATAENLAAWKAKINALSDDECRAEGCMRGYTPEDIVVIETALTELKADYSGPASIGKIIIRKPDGTYAKRTA